MNNDALLYEIQNLEKEVALLKGTMKKHNTRIKTLMEQVIKNLVQNNIETYVYNGKTYKVQEAIVAGRIGDKRRKNETVSLLTENGLSGLEAVEIYDKLVSTIKGPRKTKVRLTTF